MATAESKAMPGDKPVSALVSKQLSDRFLAAVAKMSAANATSDMKAFIPAAEEAIRLLQKLNHLENGGADPDAQATKPPLVEVEVMWAIYGPDDNRRSFPWPSEEKAIDDELFQRKPNITWKDLYDKGYRCHQVELHRVRQEASRG